MEQRPCTEQDWQKVYPEFKKSEWLNYPDLVSRELVLTLYDIRIQANVPVFIHEACAMQGHSAKSRHYPDPDNGRPLADAVDFHFSGNISFAEQFNLITSHQNIGGIGFYPFWRLGGSPCPGWHIDGRPRKDGQPLFWVRDHERTYHYSYSPDVVLKQCRAADMLFWRG